MPDTMQHNSLPLEPLSQTIRELWQQKTHSSDLAGAWSLTCAHGQGTGCLSLCNTIANHWSFWLRSIPDLWQHSLYDHYSEIPKENPPPPPPQNPKIFWENLHVVPEPHLRSWPGQWSAAPR